MSLQWYTVSGKAMQTRQVNVPVLAESPDEAQRIALQLAELDRWTDKPTVIVENEGEEDGAND